MSKTKIVFYTQVYFLDNALEYAKLLTESEYEVHFILNITPNQLKTNILNVNIDITNYYGLNSFETIKEEWELGYIESYLLNCKSVTFAVFPSKGLRKTYIINRKIEKYIKNINPDIIHLDEVSNRHLFLFPFILKQRQKVILNIHDPVLHSGENDLLRNISRKLLFNFIPKFVVFSKYSGGLLQQQLSSEKQIFILKLLPYTIYSKFLKNDSLTIPRKFISFVGRISPYKGIEIFVESIDKIRQKFPNEQFAIGGKTINGYNPDFLKKDESYLDIRNKFLSIEEMTSLINQSKLIVCPYIDATQSGVVMTAYALGTPVLVSNKGGLAEYVEHGVTGLITQELTPEGIANTICEFLENYPSRRNSDITEMEKIEEKYKNEIQPMINGIYQ